MNRKKLKKEKQEAIAKLDIDILTKINEMVDWTISIKDSKNIKKAGSSFSILSKAMMFAMQIKCLANQRKLLASKPSIKKPKEKVKHMGLDELTENLNKSFDYQNNKRNEQINSMSGEKMRNAEILRVLQKERAINEKHQAIFNLIIEKINKA